LSAPARALPAAQSHAPATNAEDARSRADVAAGRGGAAARALHHRRPTVGRPFDARVSWPAHRSSADGTPADHSRLSARVHPALGTTLTYHPPHAASLTP